MGLLRLLLALSVVAAHAGAIWKFDMVGGKTAVETFYIISGFYMSLILNEKYIGSKNSFRLFITNRLLKLFPIYWIVLMLSIIAFAVAYKAGFPSGLAVYNDYKVQPGSMLFLILTNILIFGQDLILFLGLNESGSLFFTSDYHTTSPQVFSFMFIPQAWTVSLELTFYLIAPFLLRKKLSVTIAVILISILIRLFICYGLQIKNDPWNYRFFPSELMFFLLGNLSYRMYVRQKTKPVSATTGKLMMVAIILFTLLFSFIPTPDFYIAAFDVKSGFYFLLAIFGIPVIFQLLKPSKPDNFLGNLSYPVYLIHSFVAAVCGWAPGGFMSSSLMITVSTLLVSVLINVLIADPIEKFRQARVDNRKLQ